MSWCFVRCSEMEWKLSNYEHCNAIIPQLKILKIAMKQRHHFANKGASSQSYVFSSSHVLGGHKKSDTTERLNWTELNWCRWYHSNGRKRRTKEPLDEGERGE